MRDKWYFQLPAGWYKLTVEERGLLSTLYSQGDEITAAWADIDTLFGSMWKTVADGLHAKRCIVLKIENGIVSMSLNLRTKVRRAYMRQHKRVSTKMSVDGNR